MPNRKQRRDTKKVMNRPELKSYVDKLCLDMATMMIDHCEKASNEAKEKGTELKFENVEDKMRESMEGMGVQLAQKVQEIVRTHSTPRDKPILTKGSTLKVTIR